MKKLLTTSLLLILAALFAATFYCSMTTEKVYRRELRRFNQAATGELSAELHGYQRGLFLSRATVDLQLAGTRLQLLQQIRHFPWGVKVYSSLTGVPALQGVQLQSDIDYSGASQSQLELPNLQLQGEKATLQLTDLAFKGDFDASFSRGTVSLEVAGVKLQTPQQEQPQLEMSGLQFSGELFEQQGLPLGHATLQLAQLQAGSGTTPLRLEGLHYRSSSRLRDEQLSSDLDLSFARLTLLDEAFDQGHVKLALEQLDAAAVRELRAAVRQLQVDLLGQQVDPLVVQFQLLGLYSQLLDKGVLLRLEQLALHAAGGSLAGTGEMKLQQIDFTGPALIARDKMEGHLRLKFDQPVFNSGYRLLERLQQNGTADRNRAVLTEQAEQLAAALVQKGVLVRGEDGGLGLDLKLAQGQGSLNDRPFRWQ